MPICGRLTLTMQTGSCIACSCTFLLVSIPRTSSAVALRHVKVGSSKELPASTSSLPSISGTIDSHLARTEPAKACKFEVREFIRKYTTTASLAMKCWIPSIQINAAPSNPQRCTEPHIGKHISDGPIPHYKNGPGGRSSSGVSMVCRSVFVPALPVELHSKPWRCRTDVNSGKKHEHNTS